MAKTKVKAKDVVPPTEPPVTTTAVATPEPEEIDVWMAMDPETLRVLIQDREFQDGDFPPGLRGLNWERRQGKISKKVYDDLRTPGFDFDESDRVHRELWSKNGKTPWPGFNVI